MTHNVGVSYGLQFKEKDPMKKFFSIMIGLSLMLGAVTLTAYQGEKKEGTKTDESGKKKEKKKKKSKEGEAEKKPGR
ncbi:MAG: hypothetical protein JJE04_16240 [Acidobacteriia bacterium]|nr:hypothetical protein [Terriglobia bacterium]